MSKFKRYALIALVAFGLFVSSVACDDSTDYDKNGVNDVFDTAHDAINDANDINDAIGDAVGYDTENNVFGGGDGVEQ